MLGPAKDAPFIGELQIDPALVRVDVRSEAVLAMAKAREAFVEKAIRHAIDMDTDLVIVTKKDGLRTTWTAHFDGTGELGAEFYPVRANRGRLLEAMARNS